MDTQTIPLAVNAERLCDAISKIGYTPEAALMDLIDNSVSASAKNVTIIIPLREGLQISTRNAALSYSVVDDGDGMTDKEIAEAFSIGTPKNYGQQSLSKYGMGLKSAGLSLGNKITIVSKKNGSLSKRSTLDRDAIRERGEFVMQQTPLTDFEGKQMENLISGNCGTYVLIEQTEHSNQRSPKTIQQNLLSKLGVVYYKFLTTGSLKSIKVEVANQTHTVEPKDIVFRSLAKTGFDPDTYDCVSPYLVADDEIAVTDDGTIPPFKFSAVVFPQERMCAHPSISETDQQQVKLYDITAQNRGFFIYRNNRLIRWGDDLNIVGKDDRNFRACISLKTEHDTIFHVDVSKQRLEISESLLDRLKLACQHPLKQARQAAKNCLDRCRIMAPGQEFNSRNADLSSEDYVEPKINTDPNDQREIIKRTERLIELSQVVAKEDMESGEVGSPRDSVFEKIRYSTNIKGSRIWEPGCDPVEGDWVRINRNHAFFDTILQQFSESSMARQSIEAIFWTLAAAENTTRKRYTKLAVEDVEALFSEFHRNSALILEGWTQRNQDLADQI
jgi:hypothetical protein